MNVKGEPMIYEVLNNSSTRTIFITENLEGAAQAEFGSPLPNRRFTIERAVTDTPAVHIPNLISDGPIPLGPMIYLSSTGEVATVACRCMPSQVQEVIATAEYLPSFKQSTREQPQQTNSSLDRALRIPSNF